jgi:hypothetical protein
MISNSYSRDINRELASSRMLHSVETTAFAPAIRNPFAHDADMLLGLLCPRFRHPPSYRPAGAWPPDTCGAWPAVGNPQSG